MGDSQRFLLEHIDTIENSPDHIYHSALPLCPTSSWLRECYSTDLSQEVKVIGGVLSGWGKCFRTIPLGMSSFPTLWKDLIAVGVGYKAVILNANTGICVSVFFGHTHWVRSTAISLNGKLLASGSCDKTIKLWDIQTGEVIKTFHGHTSTVDSVSISADYTTIASGSDDETIRLWDVLLGECHHVIDGYFVTSINFSPTNPQLLTSASEDNGIQQWDIDGHKVGPAYQGSSVAFSSDGTHFVSWEMNGSVAIVRNTSFGVVIAELHFPNNNLGCCCFSPDGRFVACGVGHDINIWDITCSNPHLVETFVSYPNIILCLVFSSSLISYSNIMHLKFWKFSASLAGTTMASSESILTTTPVETITLQANEGIAISIDSAGVVRVWDISTGLCKDSFQTPAIREKIVDIQYQASPSDPDRIPRPIGPLSTRSIRGAIRDVRLIGGKVILVWCRGGEICIWDVEKGTPFQTVDAPPNHNSTMLRISGDGSKFFLQMDGCIQAFDIWTGEVMGEVRLGAQIAPGSLMVSGSRIGGAVYNRDLKKHEFKWWDLGTVDSTPTSISVTPLERPDLDFVSQAMNTVRYSKVKNTVTGKAPFYLSGKYAKPCDPQWDGRYLVAGYDSGEVLILDFHHLLP